MVVPGDSSHGALSAARWCRVLTVPDENLTLRASAGEWSAMERPWSVHVAWFAIVCISIWSTRALGRLNERVEGRRAVARGKRGELNAERILKRLGYRIVSRQAGAAYEMTVDGARRETHVQADLIVERAGRRLVAEVKTGAQATRVEHEGTRRQLLEYQLAFGGDAVLLVDGERGDVRELRFPLSGLPVRRGNLGGGLWLIAGFVLVLIGFGVHADWWREGLRYQRATAAGSKGKP